MKTVAKQILLIEDDRFLRCACAVGLRQRGWTVLTAVDGEEALRLSQTEAIDLILSRIPLEQTLAERGHIPLGFLLQQLAAAWGRGPHGDQPPDPLPGVCGGGESLRYPY